MAIGSGVDKQVIYKKQTALGTKATASGAQVLRRTTSGIELKKNTFQSNEIRTDYQVADFRHGSKYIEGPISGEISPATYKDFMAAAVRKDFVAGSSIASLTLTTAGSGPTYTITRSAGSWITDGVKVGDIVRVTAGLAAGNLNKNYLVASLTATVLTVYVLNGTSISAQSAIAACTLSVTGKKTLVPQSSHTADYFTIEQWYGTGVAMSEQFYDCKVNSMDIQLPASGMATCSFGFLGRNLDIGSAAYFTSPTAATTTGVMAGAQGILIVGGASVGNVTGMNFTLNGSMTKEDVVGASSTPDVFSGSVLISGQMTILLENDTYMQMFEDETEASVTMALTATSAANSDFVAFTMPRIKVGGNSKDDGQKGIVQTVPFTALLNTNSATNNGDVTTLMIQDSAA
ncbi:MAG TPA: phage tail tube protein [Nitrosomonas sp.]|nr:phage tail tube protein [Nitrosomonas sp.]HND36603.1 phage tail tube protein [Nitrosomonas sp.]